jgi:hypothetical protein
MEEERNCHMRKNEVERDSHWEKMLSIKIENP